MKANVKRPARFSFKTITEKKAKHLTLIFVAVLFLVIVVLALFPLLDREEERYEVTTYAMGIFENSSSVSLSGFSKISLPTAIFPISCSAPAR